MVLITFKIDKETLQELNQYSQSTRKSKSAVIKDAIDEMIREGIKTKPRKVWGNSTVMAIKIDPDFLKVLDEFAKQNKISRAFAIRTAVNQYLKKRGNR